MGGWDAPWHWIVLALIFVALFGYKKMPEMARSVGKSLRIFKTEMKGMTEDDSARSQAVTGAPPSLEPSPATPAPQTPSVTMPSAATPPPGAAPAADPEPTPATVPAAPSGAVAPGADPERAQSPASPPPGADGHQGSGS